MARPIASTVLAENGDVIVASESCDGNGCAKSVRRMTGSGQEVWRFAIAADRSVFPDRIGTPIIAEAGTITVPLPLNLIDISPDGQRLGQSATDDRCTEPRPSLDCTATQLTATRGGQLWYAVARAYGAGDGVFSIHRRDGWSLDVDTLDTPLNRFDRIVARDDESVFVVTGSRVLFVSPDGGLRSSLVFPDEVRGIALGRGELVYITQVGALEAYDMASDPPALVWRAPGTLLLRRPAVSADEVVVVSDAAEAGSRVGVVKGILDGRVIWTVPIIDADTNETIVGAPTIGPDGSVFVASVARGCVYAIR